MKPVLVFRADDGTERKIVIEGSVQLGREERGYRVIATSGGKEIFLGFTDSTVSRRHASLYWDGGELMVKDLGSRNGTFLNGQPLPSWQPGKETEAVAVTDDCTLTLGKSQVGIKVRPVGKQSVQVTHIHYHGDFITGDKIEQKEGVIVHKKGSVDKTQTISEQGE